MYSTATIRSMSDKASRAAARKNRKPYVPYDETEIKQLMPTDLPFLGDHVPDDWEAVGEAKFCDSFGLGTDHEPANSVPQWRTWMQSQPGMGFAVVEAGQFQCYVQAYQPPATRKLRRNPKRKGKPSLDAPVILLMRKAG